jgi:hypothetical protein
LKIVFKKNILANCKFGMAKMRDEKKMRDLSRDKSRDGKETCATCEKAFRVRNLQIVLCKLVVHRACLPEDLPSTNYVRMKKYKEALDFKCVECFGRHQGCTSRSVFTRKKKAMKPTKPSSERKPQVSELK